MADGSLNFDTKISEKGFLEGIGTLEKAMNALNKTIDTLGRTIHQAFTIDSSQPVTATEKISSGIAKISTSAKTTEEKLTLIRQRMADLGQSKIPTQEYVEVTKAVERTQAALDKLLERQARMQDTGVKENSNAYKNLQYDIEQAKNSLNAMKADQMDLESSGMAFTPGAETAEYIRLRTEMERLNAEAAKQTPVNQQYQQLLIDIEKGSAALDGLIAKQEKMDVLGTSQTSRSYQSLQYDIQKATTALDELLARKAEMESSGSITTPLADTTAYENVTSSVENARQSSSSYFETLNNVDQAQGNVEKSATKMNKSTKGADSSFISASKAGNILSKSFFRLGNMFKMMLTRMAMKALIGGIKEGFQNLAQYSDEFNASMSSLTSSFTYLKNSFAAGFAPILSFVIPALNALINTIASAVAWIGQLASVLSGKGTFIRAKKVQEDYASSLKKTGGAAKQAGKDAQKALLPFDQLTILQEKSSGGSGGGGGGGSGIDPSEMFEEIAVSGALVAALDNLKAKWAELSSIFKNGFKIGFGDTSRLDKLKNSLLNIGSLMKDIFTAPEVIDASKRWMETTIFNLGQIVGAVASIGVSIATNIVGGIEMYLTESRERIVQYLVNMFDISGQTSTILANFMVAVAEIFTALESEGAISFTASLIGMFTNGFMGTTELLAKLGRDILDILLTPITDNSAGFKSALEGLLLVGSQVMGDLEEVVTDSFARMNSTYDEHIAPMFQSFKDGLTEIYGAALEAFETHILPSLKKVADKFTEFKNQHLQPLINKFIDFGGHVADVVKLVWENNLQPFFKWAVEIFSPLLGTAIEQAGGFFLGFQAIAITVTDGVLGALDGFLTFLEGVFTSDIEKALEGIQGIFKSIFNGIIGVVEMAINYIVDGLNSVSIDVPAIDVPGFGTIGGNHIGFDVSKINLPRLATGTVVPPRAGEFAAILGDNNRETEVVSPLSTMKQAMLEAMVEAGGMGSGSVRIALEVGGRQIHEVTVDENQIQSRRTGRNQVLE